MRSSKTCAADTHELAVDLASTTDSQHASPNSRWPSEQHTSRRRPCPPSANATAPPLPYTPLHGCRQSVHPVEWPLVSLRRRQRCHVMNVGASSRQWSGGVSASGQIPQAFLSSCAERLTCPWTCTVVQVQLSIKNLSGNHRPDECHVFCTAECANWVEADGNYWTVCPDGEHTVWHSRRADGVLLVTQSTSQIPGTVSQWVDDLA